jgi:flagellar motor protein MotB
LPKIKNNKDHGKEDKAHKDQQAMQHFMQNYHSSGSEMPEEEGHSWAVSYADFLMTLLSFFIIFFSISNKEENLELKALLAKMKQDQKEEIKLKVEEETKKTIFMTNKDAQDGLPRTKKYGDLRSDQFENSLTRLGITIEYMEDEGFFILKLPNNMYAPGEISLNPKGKELMKKFFHTIKPFETGVDVTIVGHTDEAQVSQRNPASLIQSNFDISVLRASKALQFAVNDLQFSVDRLSAKGSADLKRSSRSLSIVIEPKNKVSKLLRDIKN